MAACSEDDKVTLFVQDNFTAGAILRTLDQTGALDMFDEDVELTWSIQEQDREKGGLLDRVEITLSFNDNNAGGNSSSGTALATITEFGSTDGLPSFDYRITFGELLNVVGLSVTDVLPGDQFVVDMELFLTDGRSFGADSTTGNVSGGSFFSSPYQYSYTVDDGIEFELEDVNANEVSLTNPNEDYAVTIIIGDSTLVANGLVQTVNVYRRFVDRSIDEGEDDLSEDEALFDTFDLMSDFMVDAETAIATYDFVVTLDDLYGPNLTFDDLGLNDGFNLRYELITFDGRVVTVDDENGIGEEFFDSVIVTECIQLNADAPFPGEYTIQFTDTFGDGWDGARFDVTIDDGETESFTLETGGSGEATFTVPEGTTTLLIEYVPGAYEEEHIFRILDPNGKAAADGGPNPTPGPVELLVCE
ncbi:hypothetical protein GTQ34_14485 [Muricauda sp. JGD-17]|uniref:Uncharacterized protein n=1 Tax=Flagellimonas ochracea TaxID=2696472 RepID=A0A964TDV6_9FLAO|nr:hypothetical protein [Allomuricauda ochracea]NAY93120.1 hypothetical protein [Allomuricauda ochracea]